jgi:hypothetical protein
LSPKVCRYSLGLVPVALGAGHLLTCTASRPFLPQTVIAHSAPFLSQRAGHALL